MIATTPLIVTFSPALDPTAAIVITRFDTETLMLVFPVDADTDGFGVGDADGERVGFGVAPATLAVTVRVVCTVFDWPYLPPGD